MAKKKKTKKPQRATRQKSASKTYGLDPSAIIAIAFLILLVSGGWILKDRIGASFDWMGSELAESSGLVLSTIEITGNERLEAETIIETSELLQGMPIMTISLPKLKERLEALGWIRNVSIRRILPDTIRIEISERQPFVLWQHEGVLKLIDETGVVISEERIKEFANLPIIVGEDAPEYAEEIAKIMAVDAALAKKISAFIRIGDRRWNVRLRSGAEIKLPEQDPLAAWELLVRFETEKKILSSAVKILDLRVPGKIFIEMKNATTQTLDATR